MASNVAESDRFREVIRFLSKLRIQYQAKTMIGVFSVMVSLLGHPAAEAAPPADLIVNGDFETGDLSGWDISHSGAGSIAVNDGTFVPTGPGAALPPIAGAFDAVTFQPGPGLHAFRQTINVPEGVFAASLSWSDRVRNHAGGYSDPNQEWRVFITDSNAVVIQDLFSTNPGDALQQVGPNSRSADVTAVLQDYAGQAIILNFEEQDNLSYFNATLDEVSLLVSVLPADKDECKRDGWQTFINVLNGVQIFKNQGDCVSFVATQGRNPPANY